MKNNIRLPNISISDLILKVLMSPFALILVILLKAFGPICRFQIIEVYKHRIGHFALETEIAALKSKMLSSRTRQFTYFYFPDVKPANDQLDRMFRRELNILSGNWGWLIATFSNWFRNMNVSSSSTTIDFHGLLIKHDPILEFTLEETKSPEIKSLKLEHGSKFVCLHVRDSAYHSINSNNPDHQLFRNSDIHSYIESAESLAELGYHVFRTGVYVNKKLPSINSYIVDYATNGMRSDFLDIYLARYATFVVSTASGWDSVPTIFRVPILKVNVLPVFAPDNFSLNHLIVPKLLCENGNKHPLTLKQIIELDAISLYRQDKYQSLGLVIRDLSSEELVEAVTEMAQRVEGTFVETPEQKEMHAKLKHILSTHPKLQPSPNYYPIRAQFASCFLSRYPNFLDGLD